MPNGGIDNREDRTALISKRNVLSMHRELCILDEAWQQTIMEGTPKRPASAAVAPLTQLTAPVACKSRPGSTWI